LYNVEDKEIGLQFQESLANMIVSGKPHKASSKIADKQSCISSLSKMQMKADSVAKLVPSRIFSVAVHPSPSCVLAAVGDKWGRVALWDVGSKMGQDGVFCYKPHSRPVNCLQWHPNDQQRLFSASYDGTMRALHCQKSVFDEIYANAEEDDNRISGFDFVSNDVLVASQSDGTMAVIDMRTSSTGAEHVYPVHRRPVKTISVHPAKPDYFITACNDGTVAVWDLRKLSPKKNTPLWEFPHSRSVNSAYFSPITGKYILTTAMDDKLRLYNVDSSMSDISLGRAIRHDNHTGRWLTGFRASWHPQRENLFVVGSMARPRQIELFDDNLSLVQKFRDDEFLGSVCSLNALHPSRNILVGGNSSGRVHVFMD